MKKKPRSAAAARRRRSRLPELGDRLRQRAEDLGLKGAEVARRAGIGRRRYNHYVNGAREPDLGTLRDISAALETTTDALLDPDWESPSQDAELREAIFQVRASCLGLSLRDARFLAELARRVGAAGRKRARNPRNRPDPVIEELRRVHERLVPALLMEFQPRCLHTEMQETDNGHVRLFIDMEFDDGGNPRELSVLIAKSIRSTLNAPPQLTEVKPNAKYDGSVTVLCVWNLGRRPG